MTASRIAREALCLNSLTFSMSTESDTTSNTREELSRLTAFAPLRWLSGEAGSG